MPEGGLVAEQIRQIRGLCKGLREEVDQHDKDLYRGNGKPGVCTRLEKLEDRVTIMEKHITDFKNAQSWALRLLVGILIAAIMNLIMKR